MKFFPRWFDEFRWSTERKQNALSGRIGAAIRDGDAMGPWTGPLGKFQPLSRQPYLLEALRESLPVLDGGIARLGTMDGIVEVQGENDALVQEIETWMRNVPVNDLATGFQAFYAGQGDEHYEQGFGVGEFAFDAKGREVVGLRVADSKGVVFARGEDGTLRTYYRPPDPDPSHRADGLDKVQQILRGCVRGSAASGLREIGFTELDPRQLVFALHRPEADQPYGTSILRSMPFVAQILLTMQASTGQTWKRFGDPSFHVHYGTQNRKVDSAEAKRRADQMAKDLGVAMLGKQRGNSVDLATAAAADDTVTIKVIGAEGQVLSIQEPARNLLEQVVAGFGLPSWMLGIQWTQASGIGEQQSVVVLQEAQTRFELRRPQLRRPIEALLRARGRTWKPRDWDLVQRLPNLMDEQKRAQAGFLRAQTAMMLGERGQVEPVDPGTGIDNNLRASRGPRRGKAKAGADDDSEGTGEPWAENDPALPRIEADATAALLAQWRALADETIAALGLAVPGDAPFQHSAEHVVAVLSLGHLRAPRMAAALLDAQLAAWDRGIANGAASLPARAKGLKAELLEDPVVAAAIAALRQRVRDAFASTGLQLVRDGLVRTLSEKIVAALASGEFDGQNPFHVADELKRRFGAGDYNWERLARSETAMAQSNGKLDLYRQQGVTKVEYVTAGDGRVSHVCLALEAANPYAIADAPVPVRDSHPNCRCSLLALE